MELRDIKSPASYRHGESQRDLAWSNMIPLSELLAFSLSNLYILSIMNYWCFYFSLILMPSVIVTLCHHNKGPELVGLHKTEFYTWWTLDAKTRVPAQEGPRKGLRWFVDCTRQEEGILHRHTIPSWEPHPKAFQQAITTQGAGASKVHLQSKLAHMQPCDLWRSWNTEEAEEQKNPHRDGQQVAWRRVVHAGSVGDRFDNISYKWMLSDDCKKYPVPFPLILLSTQHYVGFPCH